MMGAGAALMLNKPLATLDAGDVAFQALGWAGIMAVIAAGWTTSNPTLYRAGLALQSITPNWSRARVTLVAGILTTVVACFPFVFTRLLDFVGFYGLLLAPVGAIVLTEHWIFPRIGLTRCWFSHRRALLNLPALLSWLIAVGFALVLERTGTLHLFYLALPVYLLTMGLYTLLASMAGARKPAPAAAGETDGRRPRGAAEPRAVPKPGGALKGICGVIALAALAACLALPVLTAASGVEGFTERLAAMKNWLLAATVVYFASGTVYYRLREQERESGNVQ
jgi:NCS1 family nucleobase:cation symporter-1